MIIKVSEENKTKTCVPPTERPTVLTQEVTIRVTGPEPGIVVGSGHGRIRIVVHWSDSDAGSMIASVYFGMIRVF